MVLHIYIQNTLRVFLAKRKESVCGATIACGFINFTKLYNYSSYGIQFLVLLSDTTGFSTVWKRMMLIFMKFKPIVISIIMVMENNLLPTQDAFLTFLFSSAHSIVRFVINQWRYKVLSPPFCLIELKLSLLACTCDGDACYFACLLFIF